MRGVEVLGGNKWRKEKGTRENEKKREQRGRINTQGVSVDKISRNTLILFVSR